MNNETKAHIRSILWQYKKIEKMFKELSDITNLKKPYSDYTFTEENLTVTLNQLTFYKMFLDTIDNILADCTSDVKDIFYAKYVNGYPRKKNEIVASETYLSESTVKRRDIEFLKEISFQLGWVRV